MDGLDCSEDLVAEAQGSGEAEGSTGLGATQFGQVFGLKLHHHIVEPFVTPTPYEATHVLAT